MTLHGQTYLFVDETFPGPSSTKLRTISAVKAPKELMRTQSGWLAFAKSFKTMRFLSVFQKPLATA